MTRVSVLRRDVPPGIDERPVSTARELAERAQQLLDGAVPVEVAVADLIRLSAGDRFALSAAYAVAVRDGGAAVTPAAALLELVQYESEGPVKAAFNDPDRLPGKVSVAYTRGFVWGAHWLVIALFLLLMVPTVDGSMVGLLGLALGCVVLAGGRIALLWYANRRGVNPWHTAESSDLAGAVPSLARKVAREAVALVGDRTHGDAVDQLCKAAIGEDDTSVTRRRASYVLREATRLLAASWLTWRTYRQARQLVTTARRHVVQQTA